MGKRREQGQQAVSGVFLWVVLYAFRNIFWRGLDNLSCLPADHAGEALLWLAFRRPKCVDRRYLCLCRSAYFFRRICTTQSGQYFARLAFGVNTAPHTAQRFSSSRLLLISAYRAASGAFLWVVLYTFRSPLWQGLDNLSHPPADLAGKALK